MSDVMRAVMVVEVVMCNRGTGGLVDSSMSTVVAMFVKYGFDVNELL